MELEEPIVREVIIMDSSTDEGISYQEVHINPEEL